MRSESRAKPMALAVEGDDTTAAAGLAVFSKILAKVIDGSARLEDVYSDKGSKVNWT